MRIVTWNMRRAKEHSEAWLILEQLDPDIVLLQEVSSIPEKNYKNYAIKYHKAISKSGNLQKFGTAILVKGEITSELPLVSEFDWVNEQLELFKGNFVSCVAKLDGIEPLNLVSVYSPAWPVKYDTSVDIDVSGVIIDSRSRIWATELIWSALKNMVKLDQNWIVGGDYNSSETFDKVWQDKNNVRYGIHGKGNVEIINRMYDLGFTECLRGHDGRITPTFKHSSGRIDHQLDHLYVTNNLYPKLTECHIGDERKIFNTSLSDHLPIIADFSQKTF